MKKALLISESSVYKVVPPKQDVLDNKEFASKARSRYEVGSPSGRLMGTSCLKVVPPKQDVLDHMGTSCLKDKNGFLISRGGGESYIHNIGKSLIKLGIEPVVFSIKEFKDQADFEEIDGISYKRFPVYSRSSFKLFKYLKAAIQESKNYDYIFLNQFTPHLILPWIKDKKRIVIIHDVYKSFLFWVKQYGFLKGLFGNFIERLQLFFDKKYADKFMTISPYTEEKILSALGKKFLNKISKNPSFIRIEDYSGDESKEDFILFAGRFIGYKNPSHALIVLKKIKEFYPNFKAVFVCPRIENKIFKKFEEEQKRLGLNDNDVILKYDLSSEEVKELFLKAKILVQPSYAEGQGIVVLEALAAKTPVIAYNLKAYEGMLVHGQNSLLAKIGNRENFANLSLEILKNYDFYRNNCHFTLKNFTEEKFVENVGKIIFE